MKKETIWSAQDVIDMCKGYMNENHVKFVEKARNRLKNNGNYDIVIDNMILKIIDHI